MAKYFHISHGLRGCYMPDSVSVIKVSSRRELKSAVAYDARDMKEAYGFGGSKRAVAAFVAECWREAHKAAPAHLPYCLPFGRKPGDYAFGLFCSVATRRDYVEYCKEQD
jgi:hypothetical protein